MGSFSDATPCGVNVILRSSGVNVILRTSGVNVILRTNINRPITFPMKNLNPYNDLIRWICARPNGFSYAYASQYTRRMGFLCPMLLGGSVQKSVLPARALSFRVENYRNSERDV